MVRGLYFFAVREDLLHVLAGVENEAPLSYRLLGTYESSEIPCSSSAIHLQDLGVACLGDWLSEKSYLVLRQQAPFTLQTVELASGRKRYFVDQTENPDSIIIRPGGLYKDDCIIMGEISTILTTQSSLQLYRMIQRAINRDFAKVGTARVGPEAYHLAKQGTRLTDRANSPRERDLVL